MGVALTGLQERGVAATVLSVEEELQLSSLEWLKAANAAHNNLCADTISQQRYPDQNGKDNRLRTLDSGAPSLGCIMDNASSQSINDLREDVAGGTSQKSSHFVEQGEELVLISTSACAEQVQLLLMSDTLHD